MGEGYELTASRRMAAMMEEITELLAQGNGMTEDAFGKEEERQGFSDETDDTDPSDKDSADETPDSNQSGITFLS